jgi:lysophospholipase L1-like esterase
MATRGDVRRTLISAVALGALLAGARAGTPRPVLLLLLLVFVAVAAVWVRGQYADSLADPAVAERLNVSRRTIVATLAVAVTVGVVAVVVFLFVYPLGGLGLSGAVLAYFGIGFLVIDWRRHSADGILVAGALLTTGILAGVLGLLGLGRWPIWVAVAPLVVTLLLLPLGLQLISEYAIRRLAGATRGRWRVGVGFGGAAIFVVVAVVAPVVEHSFWLLVAVIVLGLAVSAIASTTQADIVAVFVVLALMGVVPYHAGVPDAVHPGGGNSVLVALGDSYMAGEGAAVFYQGTDDGGGDKCHRAPTAWAAIAGQQAPFDRLAFLACAGARTFNVRSGGLPNPVAQPGERLTQLAAYRKLQQETPFTPRLVVLSLGGNDAGFATLGEMCLAPGDCNVRNKLWFGVLAQMQARIESTYDEVASTFPSTPVLVTAYPDPLASKGRGGCGQLELSQPEREFISSFVTALNSVLAQAAAHHGFYYLDRMEQALALSHLQLCDPRNDGRPGLNFIGFRSVRGIAEQRFNPVNWLHNSLHPNEAGHQAMLRVFEAWEATHRSLAARTPATTPAPPASIGPPGTAAAVAAPPCDLLSVTTTGCLPQARTWTLQKISEAMLPAGILIGLLATLGASAASVAFFGWRRKVNAAGADERDQVQRVDRPPPALGGLDELEGRGQSGGPLPGSPG